MDKTTLNARAILEAIGKRDVKVYPGASKPIIRDAVSAVDIHGIPATNQAVTMH
jgi:uridine nucleosidase